MTPPPRTFVRAVLTPALLVALGLVAGRVEADQPAPVTLPGRVVELGTGRPVAGAAVAVTRSAGGTNPAPPWVGTTTLRTDADGRFVINVPPDQAADPGAILLAVRIEHPDFIARKSFATPLTVLLGELRDGASRFEGMTLERGEVHTARVVNPDGGPAAGVSFAFENWSFGSNQSKCLANADDGRADAAGRLRLMMPRTKSLALRLTPERAAPYQHFWGNDGPDKGSIPLVPLDLGEIRLDPGIVLAGRLLDEAGRPLAGRGLVAQGRSNRFERPATTDARGRFAFAPLRPGNYLIYGAGQGMYGGIDPSRARMPADATVVRPTAVFLESEVEPVPLELRESPTVRVVVRFVDSAGKPARGATVTLTGSVPNEDAKAAAAGFDEPNFSPASAINNPEPRFKVDRLAWGAQMIPNAAGLVEFQAPRGLRDADLYTIPPDGATAFRTRLQPGGPLRSWGGGRLGTLDADRTEVEVVVSRAPTILIRLATEEGEPVPAKVEIGMIFTARGFSYGETPLRLPDGRYQTVSMMPDHEYDLSAWAPGYVPRTVLHPQLPEGATAEVDLVLRRKPTKPIVGDLAPPFAVTTEDGQLRTLPDYRGKFLLIHSWTPFHGQDRDLARVEAIGRRVGADRLAVLGLALTADADAARRVIVGRQIAWPQAILRDEGADAAILDYGGVRAPDSVLIGPDGTILARGQGEPFERAALQILGARPE